MLWQLSYPKVRPVRALKAGREASEISSSCGSPTTTTTSSCTCGRRSTATTLGLCSPRTSTCCRTAWSCRWSPTSGPRATWPAATTVRVPSNETCVDGTCQCPGNLRRGGADRSTSRAAHHALEPALQHDVHTPDPADDRGAGLPGVSRARHRQAARPRFPWRASPVDYDAKGVAAPRVCGVPYDARSALVPVHDLHRVRAGGASESTSRIRMTFPAIAGQAPNIADNPGGRCESSGRRSTTCGSGPTSPPIARSFAQNAVSDYWTRLGRARAAGATSRRRSSLAAVDRP